MTLQSMTGFARIEGQNDHARWVWEVRSVNGKGLDFRLRLPPGMDNLQPHIRKSVAKTFSRGNLQINLNIEREGAQQVPKINQPALDAVVEAVENLHAKIDCAPPSAEQMLAIKGVLEIGGVEESDAQKALNERALLTDFDKLVRELETSRVSEGSAIIEVLADQLRNIDKLTTAIIDDPSRTLEQVKIRLQDQVSRLLDNASGLDLDRVHQEAAILAAKADLQEELDRLNSHLKMARELLAGEGPVGRKLDFLTQEFNRECNTICSKSNASSVTAFGLDMKVVIDQFREQVQNLE